MSMRGIVAGFVVALVLGAGLAGAALAEPAAAPPAAEGVVVAQATGGGQTTGAEREALPNRVESLEKESVVLREDLGKARLETRTQIDAVEKRNAEAMARMQQKIDELNAQLQEERQKQERRNRQLWLAFGVVLVAVLASD